MKHKKTVCVCVTEEAKTKCLVTEVHLCFKCVLYVHASMRVCECMCVHVHVCRRKGSDSDECVLTDGVTPPKPASTSSSALLSRLNIEVKPPFISLPHKDTQHRTSTHLFDDCSKNTSKLM